jgi:hypothetical protein
LLMAPWNEVLEPEDVALFCFLTLFLRVGRVCKGRD